jgi:hypothetical protein
MPCPALLTARCGAGPRGSDRTRYESGGRLWPLMFGRLMAGLGIYQVTMIGAISLKCARSPAHCARSCCAEPLTFARPAQVRLPGGADAGEEAVAGMMWRARSGEPCTDGRAQMPLPLMTLLYFNWASGHFGNTRAETGMPLFAAAKYDQAVGTSADSIQTNPALVEYLTRAYEHPAMRDVSEDADVYAHHGPPLDGDGDADTRA